MNKAKFARILLALLAVSYPFAVYFGLQVFPPSFFGLVLVVALALRFGLLLPEERSTVLPVLILFLIFAVAAVILDSARLLLLYPALVNFTLCVVFAVSLKSGEPLLLRFVRARGIPMSEHAPRYLYWLTLMWAVFFVINGLIAIWTGMISLRAWTLYNGLISYFIVAILIAGEWLFRRYYKKRVGAGN